MIHQRRGERRAEGLGRGAGGRADGFLERDIAADYLSPWPYSAPRAARSCASFGSANDTP